MNKFTVCAFLLLSVHFLKAQPIIDPYGALVRSDTLKKNIYLCFSGHDYVEGFSHVLQILKAENVQASFFLTGDFIKNHTDITQRIIKEGHYVGPHSNSHLLYCDWDKRDSLLQSPKSIKKDIQDNLKLLKVLGMNGRYFLPPYEWYNKKVVSIANDLEQITINFTSGTRSNADYTTPNMPNYVSSKAIMESIYEYEKTFGMNGFHLLIHPGTQSLRKDKLYMHLDALINYLKTKGYQFKRF